MAHKKHKIIALATSTVALSSTALAAGVIISSNAIANARKAEAIKASLHVAADADFKWSSDRSTIQGFKNGITTAEIEALIVDSKLTLPECQYIAKGAFDYAFDKVSSSFELVLHKNVKEIGDNAFMGNTKITSISYYDKSGAVEATKSNLKSIGLGGFEKTGLTAITIPNGCKIGEKAFYKCSDLAEINLSDRESLFTDIGSHAFQGIKATGELKAPKMSNETANAMASNLETTTWGGLSFATTATTGKWTIVDKAGTGTRTRTNTVPTIYLDIDEDTKELKAGLKRGTLSNYDTLYIPKEVVSLGSNAFVDTETLTSVTFADNSECNSIGNDCFKGCTNLEGTLTLPASLKSIGRQAFYKCENITKLDMSKICFGGSSRSFSVGTEAFYGWSEEPEAEPIVYPTRESTTGMTQDQINGVFAAALSNTGQINDEWISTGVKASDAEYAAATTTQKVLVEGDESYEYQITAFDLEAESMQGVTAINFQPNSEDPDANQEIISNLFYDESTGKSTLPPTITTIDMSKANVVEIGQNAFRGSNVSTVVLSDSTETIGEGAFQDCTNLSGIALPSSLTSIGAKAFAGCDNAYYLDLSKLNNQALLDLIALQNDPDVAAEDKPIGELAFFEYGKLCENGGTILWADDVTTETKDAFIAILEQAGLTEGWCRDAVDGEGTAGGIPIKDPYKTTDNVILVIENNVLKSINWTNLESYLEKLSEEKAAEVTSIPLIIPRSVTSIADSFWGNPTSAKVSVVNKLYFAVGSKCTSIGSAAFSGATNFTGSLSIPEGVTRVGQSAFTGCTGFNGTLTLPSTINKDPGIGNWAFSGCTGFQSLDVSAWDNDLISSWTSASHSIGTESFLNWSTKAVVVPYAGITTANLTTLQTYLKEPGKFPSEQFGQDATSYDVSQHGQLNPTTFETESKLRLLDNKDNKDKLAEAYIDAINSDEVELVKGSTTEKISGVELLKHDLMATFAQAYCDYAELGVSDPVINVNLSNIVVHGDRISFNVVGNINVYMNTYEMGIATQFSTSVKNLHITSTSSFARTRKTITAKQIGINFTVDTDTEFATDYDKEYIYGNDEQGNYKETTIVDVSNTSFKFEELLSQFDEGVWYNASTSAGVKLHSLSRQAFAAAPGLFSALFGVYDNTELTGLTDGRDHNGMLYTPYLESGKDASDNLIYQMVPFEGKFASPSFGEFAVYDLGTSDDPVYAGETYVNHAWNYTNNTIQHSTAQMTTTEALAEYKSWLQNTATYGTTLASGRLFKEDLAYSTCSAIQTIITSYFATNKYTRLEQDDFTFYQLYKEGTSTPIDVLTLDDNGDLRATFGVELNLCMHDEDFVWDGTPPSGAETINSFKHVFEIHLPLQFHNVKLYNISKTEKNKLSLWSIADNKESAEDNSYMVIGNGGEETCSKEAYLRTIEYDDDAGKFTTVYTFADKSGKYTYEDINEEIRGAGISTVAELEEYMEEKWPLLYNLNFIKADKDSAGNLYVSLDFSSWYLKNISLK